MIKSKQIAKSRLTDALINRLHNYFGIALRSNAKSELKPELKHQELLASMFHVASSRGENYHTYCPKTSDSWCQYHRDYINQNVYKPGPGIANDVMKEIKTIYQDLTKDNDLVPAWNYTKCE